MKKNKYIIILVVLLAVVALVLVLTNSTTTFRRSMSDFAVADTSTVTKIFMSDKNNNSVKLSRKETGSWVLNDSYQALKFNIDLMLKTMTDIQVKAPVALAAHNTIVKHLAVNGVKVEIYQMVYRVDFMGIRWFPHEKLTKVYYIGGATPDNQACYALMENSEEPYVIYLPGLRGFVTPRYSTIERYWRDLSVFRYNIEDISSVKLEVPETPEYSFEVRLDRGRLKSFLSLSDNKPMPDLDTLKVLNFLSGFRNVNFEAFLNDMDKHTKDSVLASKPFIIITLSDTLNKTKIVKTYHKPNLFGQKDFTGRILPYDPDRLYALVNGGKDFVLIQYFSFNKILRPKPYFSKGFKMPQEQPEGAF
ncbi:MAG: DUF4340 domain-containing protein [Bacteroidetes bacterium]|nr:DUF4340 domain-containing protein [Bacteroidota bacterium]